MNAEQWKAAYELLELAGRLPADERVAYIQNATSDSDVQSEVLAMLEDPAPAEASEPAPAAWHRLGQTIGRFVITGAVGRGGMGEVYSAHDAELNRTVALKFLSV